MSPVRPAAVICLAAGEGTRMRSELPKVLHAIGGRTLLGHAVAVTRAIDPVHLVVVVRHGRDAVAEHVSALDPTALLADQDEVAGTGRAVECGLQALPPELTGTVVVTMGDVPLLEAGTLQALVHAHQGSAVTLVTASLPDPHGYGRILRDPDGQVERVVEQRDADDEQAAINEINSGIYAFDVEVLRAALEQVGTDNAQGEKYLTDVVAIARRGGHRVGAHLVEDRWQTEGVNDRMQLAGLGGELNRRILLHWMQAGVTVVDPATTWVDVDVRLGRDVTLLPGTQLHGDTVVESGARIGPDTTLTDVRVDAGASVVRTHGSGARIGAGASVGPFAYLRPGTELHEAAKVGTFVETKNAELGPGAKVPHLSYIGDASIGEGSNIGAGTITANYDGATKSRTTVGRHCRTGSDNVFVAPVRLGDGAFTGAGTVVRTDVAPGALAVSGGRQRQVEDWVARKRPGSAADRAAGEAQMADGAQSGGTAAPNEEPHA
ncbi:MAG: bifunctional UDP-N-acetylglucosamine diphosphorylase/glucosamine-1-phosphate N-acetyltransferase GlmU [Nocardioidaceae bacterium]|nr:bifunctional UDP-N-acetylglucosamine diphosphorylase/glucosamine-1-phosphate N-acetyltransferase GlmU [Nocardioidaceae bacterium]